MALEHLGAAAEVVHLKQFEGREVEPAERRQLSDYAALFVPGGFSAGDYVRAGAIFAARIRAAIGPDLETFVRDGHLVGGICNGFQVLTEAGLLPGALRRNTGLRFVCTTVPCVVASSASVLTGPLAAGTRLALPVNHGEGSFTCDEATLRRLEDRGQVVLRYEDNPNGSVGDVAGIANAAGNVVGIMPHPERASSDLLGSSDGIGLLEAFVAAATASS